MTALSMLYVHSPYTGELVGEVPVTGPSALGAALDAGAAHGSQLSRHERSQVLFTVAELVGAQRDALSRLISSESGLCLKDSRHEVGRTIDVFRFAAMEALRDDGAVFAGDISPHGRDLRAYTIRVPVRLVGAITPFNHPLNQVAHKLAPAIAAGAPVVLKPSEKTPLSALRLGELLVEAGLPSPAAQIVCGDAAAILDAFLDHEAVELISFTGGSPWAGRSLPSSDTAARSWSSAATTR
jgi:acyl-CoA reductase-like NAD-dependent aldehyde dehydrogenase